MGNKTTVTTLSIGGAIGLIFAGVIRYIYPDFVAATPGFEGAVTLIAAASISYLKESK